MYIYSYIVQKPWKRKPVLPLGQAPKDVYDHCAHFIKDSRILIIYGGRNHKLFSVRGGRTAFSDVYILNLNDLVWCQVKLSSGQSMERYLFNSFVLNNKLLVFSGLNYRNFAGCNVNRLELLEEEANFLKVYKEENVDYGDYM